MKLSLIHYLKNHIFIIDEKTYYYYKDEGKSRATIKSSFIV
jgi:hypothetical protein